MDQGWRPETGQSQWLLLPSVNVEVFSLALAHFAQAVGAGPHRHVVLVLGMTYRAVFA